MKKFGCWELFALLDGKVPKMMLDGPPGTGKTTTPYRSTPKGKAVVMLTLTEETGMAEVRGHFVPKGSAFEWHNGPGLRAWALGARLIINEIDRGSADVQSFLLALCDDPEVAAITLPTGETVRPAEGFEVIATMNGSRDDLTPALRDRFPVSIHIDSVHPDAMACLPEQLREVALRTSSLLDPERKVSIRSWIAFGMAVTKGVPIEAALWAIFRERAEDIFQALTLRRA